MLKNLWQYYCLNCAGETFTQLPTEIDEMETECHICGEKLNSKKDEIFTPDSSFYEWNGRLWFLEFGRFVTPEIF